MDLPAKGHLCTLINNNGECEGRVERVEHMGVTSTQVGQCCPWRVGAHPPSVHREVANISRFRAGGSWLIFRTKHIEH